MLRESLSNVAQHAHASRAVVKLTVEDQRLSLSVKDDGVGFDASSLSVGAHPKGGFGLFSIREQLSYLGGYFDVQSEPGAGTRATLSAPLAPETHTPDSGDRP